MSFHQNGRSPKGRDDSGLYAPDAVFRPDAINMEEPGSGYLWCRECERVFQYGRYRPVGGEQCCPFEECEAPLDEMAYAWEVRRAHHPAFPAYPIEGKMYRRGC